MIARLRNVIVYAAALLSLGVGCAHARPTQKQEFKLFVTATNTESALQSLQLDEHRAQKGIVCFFDTSDQALAAHHLILRARQQDDGSGDSTVKFRATGGATELSAVEQAILPEQDWTDEKAPILSRSVDRDTLSPDLVAKVAAGQGAIAELFNEAQRKLVAARVKDFNWETLRCYGPVEARVWRQQGTLPGFPKAVTVELWHMQKDGRRQDILEVSTTFKTETDAQAQALARQFFGAAQAAGLGAPTGQTKTKAVLDFYQPGR